MGRHAVACALAMGMAALPAHAAQHVRPEPAAQTVDSAAVRASQPLPLSHDHVDARRLALTRAAFEHARGDLAAVVRALEPLALEANPPFPDADRAAFLLGHAWLRLGQRERFMALARAASTWTPSSAFTRWLAFELRLTGVVTTSLRRKQLA